MVKYAAIFIVLLASCRSAVQNQNDNTATSHLNPGTLLAADSFYLQEEKPNDFYFSTKLLTNANTDSGSYTVAAAWGKNNAESNFRMPRGGENLKPVLRKGTGHAAPGDPYSFIIGFYFKDDTTFHDYYLISGQKGMISMKYIKAYSLQ